MPPDLNLFRFQKRAGACAASKCRHPPEYSNLKSGTCVLLRPPPPAARGHFNLFRFQKETSCGRALLTLPPTEARQFQVSTFKSSCTSKNPKKIVLPQADLNFEFQSQPWWTKCEWRLPPLDIKSNFTKLKIST